MSKVQEHIQSHTHSIDSTVKNVTLVTLGILAVGIIILFKKFPVEITTPLDVNLTNPSITVDVSNTGFDANITNSSLDVNVLSAPPVTVSATVDLTGYEDAFSRLRVSEPYTLGDYKHVYFNDPSFLNVTATGGVVGYIQNESCVTLSTNGVNGSSAIHQTRQYHHYQPGKSQFILSSFVFGAANAGNIKRTGYFDDNNGIFLQQAADGTLSWNVRYYVTGSPTILESKNRSLWNKDPCDGTGPSGFNVDITKTQLIFIDFQWLGVGRVRCGFVHDGRIIIAHEFYHSNVIATPYLTTPSLPVRCEISCSGGAAGTMKQICSTVMSEGGYAETGFDFSVNTGNLGRDCDVGGTKYPLLAIRLKTSFKGVPNRVSVRLTNLAIYTENSGIIWELWKLPAAASLTGTVTWSNVNTSLSAVEYSVFPDGINTTDCILLDSGFNPAGSANAGNNVFNVADPSKARKVLITQNYSSTDSEIFVVVAVPVGSGLNSNANCFSSLQWREIY